MTEKKPSLFKQRMKQLAATGERPAAEVFKVDPQQPPMEIERPIQKALVAEEPSSSYKPLLQELQRGSLISSNEYEEISKHNDEYLQKLSEEEVRQMQAQLQQELSPDFLSKLYKSVHGMPLGTATEQPKQLEQVEEEKPRQESPIKPPVVSIDQPEKEELRLTICDRMNKLCINPTTGELSYSDEECPAQIVNIHLIGLMVDSGNNQSLTTGLKVLGQLLVAVRRLPQTYGIAIVGPYYWHLPVLLEYIGTSVVQRVLKQLSNNSFKTFRLQCIETLLLFAAIGGNIDGRLLAELKQEAIRSKNQASFPNELLEAKPAERMVSIWRKLQSPHCLQTAQQLSILLNNPTILIEKLMIEHAYYPSNRPASELPEMGHYYEDLLQLLRTYPEQNRQVELENAISMLHRIVESCALKLKIHEEMVVRSFLRRFGLTFQQFFVWVLNNSHQSIEIYRVLLCLKKSNKLRFIELLTDIQQDKLCKMNFKSTVEPVLSFINLKEYAQHSQAGDRELLNQMLTVIHTWLESLEQGFISMELVLLRLFKIFRLPEETYQNLDQSLLESVFSKTIDRTNTSVLSRILEEHMPIIKKLVDGYIFNSFGSLVFSKLLIFLASNVMPAAAQTYITTECFQRYPFIFYEAGKTGLFGLKLTTDLYAFTCRSSNLQEQLRTVAKMLQDKDSESQHNGFLRLLR